MTILYEHIGCSFAGLQKCGNVGRFWLRYWELLLYRGCNEPWYEIYNRKVSRDIKNQVRFMLHTFNMNEVFVQAQLHPTTNVWNCPKSLVYTIECKRGCKYYGKVFFLDRWLKKDQSSLAPRYLIVIDSAHCVMKVTSSSS